VDRPSGSSGCLSLFLVLIGIVLLLPGICSAIFMVGMGTSDGGLVVIWVGTFVLAGFGVCLIGIAGKISRSPKT
jgi:hypothetical protein